MDHHLPRRARHLRAEGYPVADEDAAHLTPALHDHVNFYGTYSFDLDYADSWRRKGPDSFR